MREGILPDVWVTATVGSASAGRGLDPGTGRIENGPPERAVSLTRGTSYSPAAVIRQMPRPWVAA